MNLKQDSWSGGVQEVLNIEGADWAQIEDAIRALDQRRHTQVVLEWDDETYMLIGGGTGRYNISVTAVEDEEEVYYTLLDDSQAAGAFESIVTGGQLGRFPAQTVVTIDHVWKAAKNFFERGVLVEDLDWLRE